MKRKQKRSLITSIITLALFILWTVTIKTFDVSPVGPNQSVVGFSSMNVFIHNSIGVNLTLYNITDWLGLVPIAFVIGFAIFGLIQLIKRKSILKVDLDILSLGVFYIVVLATYLLFEIYPINYRPVLINNVLEPSYPSSTTLLVTTVIPSVIIQFNLRVKNKLIRNLLVILLIIFVIFMVVARIFSGVHWISDIVGGILISTSLVYIYLFIIKNN